MNIPCTTRIAVSSYGTVIVVLLFLVLFVLFLVAVISLSLLIFM